MIFHGKRKHIPELKILIDGCNIECVSSFNIFCVMLDQGLSWNNHVDLVKNFFYRYTANESNLSYNWKQLHSTYEPSFWKVYIVKDLRYV